MAIPNYQGVYLPLLQLLQDGQEYSLRQVVDLLSKTKYFNLTSEEQNKLQPSGRQTIFGNRVGWSLLYLKKAGLIESTKRGFYLITDRGLKAIKEKPEKIDNKFLSEFEEFRKFRAITREKSISQEEESETTPEESFANAYENIRGVLANDLLEHLKASSPKQFESIVIDLLVAMGYGGNRKEAAKVIGKSGDEGIDGIINEDRLGLDVIYVQAKKWEATVQRPEIHKFVGALQGQHAKKGIFITTSDFSKGAIEYVKGIENKIVLIDGNDLVQYMIDHNIGVTPYANYEVKKINSDYFSEEG